MANKPKEFDFEAEYEAQLRKLRSALTSISSLRLRKLVRIRKIECQFGWSDLLFQLLAARAVLGEPTLLG